MKVATQDLAAPVHLPSSLTATLNQASEADVRRICKLQLEQLAAGLHPTVTVGIVYQDIDTGRQLLVKAVTEECLCLKKLAFLQQEAWLAEDWSRLQVIKLTCLETEYVYVCCLGDCSLLAPEYIFLLTCEPLTLSQQNLVVVNAQLLSDYLTMYRQLSCKIAEVASLAHVLGRAEHQLRHPLALIKLFAENLRLAVPAGSLQEQVAVIGETVAELSQNLTNLLCCGQKAEAKIGQYDLKTIATQTIAGLQPWLEQKGLQVSYPAESVSLAVDRWQMKQVFENLLSNAIYFSPPGETIACDWRVYCAEVLVTICNHGSGISPAALQDIFKPYVSQRPGGTGLGLAIAQKIILDHHGDLWAENLPTGGVQFSFTLPLKKHP